MFRGKEGSRASALLSFKPQDMNDSLDDLGADELHVLEDKFIHKYPKVGKLVKQVDHRKRRDEGHMSTVHK
ncbi:hypothetical protein G4B88_008246 [Cannabis sativa]|uniref:Uncharacterized protein n=1 Tax=Cannabis sativa TaxID=3483 RepID=A0A7J6FLE7_CANSA|nr:hypothetical protein G4B88_008246 [Cannabis sativa]